MSTKNPNQTLLQSVHQTASDLTPGKLAGSSSAVAFAFQGVQPPSLLYVDVDDNLVISAASSQTNEVVTVNVRLLLPNGRLEDMQFPIRPLNTRAILTGRSGLAQGYILSVSAVAAVAFTRGQTFARIGLQRSASGSGSPAQILFADYVTNQATSAYPNGRVLSPTEGPGFVQGIQVANPVAGADWTINVPTNARWRVRSWQAQLVTAVAAANRQAGSTFKTGVNSMFTGRALVAQVASLTVNYSAYGSSMYTPADATNQVLPLPVDLVIASSGLNSMQLASSTLNIQAADQWQNIFVLLEEWLDNI